MFGWFNKFIAGTTGTKEANMAESNATAPAVTTSNAGGVDVAKLVSDSIAAALKPVTDQLTTLAQNQKVLADTLAKLPPAPSAEKAKGKDQETALNAESVQKLVSETVTTALQQHTKSQQQTAARETFIQQHLAKLPRPYHGLLGQDPAKWAEEAKAIQQQYEADFGTSGAKPHSVGTAATTGTVPSPQLDPSKMTREQFAATYLPKVPGVSAVETKPGQPA
ncbi:MAG: hypothetical protein ACM359_16515 [Bacillota bacterium]